MEHVTYEKQGHIAQLTLSRPEKLNAFNAKMQDEIWQVMHEIEADDEVRAAVVTGSGRAFCTGADLIQLERPGLTDDHHGSFWSQLDYSRHDQGWEMSKPLVAAIHGYAVAGGLELALFCDIRVAAEDTKFGCPEVKWNILHGYGASRLTTMVPMSDAMMMLLTGKFIDSAEAYRIGLISRVLEDHAAAIQEAHRIAGDIAKNGPQAIRFTKQLAQRGRYPIQDAMRIYKEYQRISLAMEDAKEGNAAFAERRDPVYRGI